MNFYNMKKHCEWLCTRKANFWLKRHGRSKLFACCEICVLRMIIRDRTVNEVAELFKDLSTRAEEDDNSLYVRKNAAEAYMLLIKKTEMTIKLKAS